MSKLCQAIDAALGFSDSPIPIAPAGEKHFAKISNTRWNELSSNQSMLHPIIHHHIYMFVSVSKITWELSNIYDKGTNL